MEHSRSILLGILAEREKNIPGDVMALAVTSWQASPEETSLAQILQAQGLLSPDEIIAFDARVDALLAEHGHRADVALAVLGGENWLEDLQRLSTMPIDREAGPGTVPMSELPFLSGEEGHHSTVEETPGRYSLVSHHAKGGMGRVLLVHDHHLQRDVAFKELLPRLDQSTIGQDTPVQHVSNMAARFLQEARITGQLEHPAIVPVYELGRRQDGSLYYTMKLVKGKTLFRAVRDCANLQERLSLLGNFLDLCHAIAYAHSRGVIHRDIKPGNIMVGQFGETVVLDWGLAKLAGEEDFNTDDIEKTLQILHEGDESLLPNTAYGRALGTPHYMPPEQAEGRIDEIDTRSDIYSLGAVLYEILSGTTPYTGKSTKEIIQKRLTEEPVPLLMVVPEAPPALASICEKALQFEKDDRYQSAIELAEDVHRFITGSLVKAYQYSMREVLGHFYRRHRTALHSAGVCAVAILAVAVYSYINILHARDLAEHANYRNQLSLTQAYIDRQDYVMANKTADATQPKQRGWEWGYLKNRANPDLWTVDTAPERVCMVALNPDASLVATVTCKGILQTWDTETGQLKTTFSPEAPVPYAKPVFSPDGTLLLAAGQDDTARIWDVATGKLKQSLNAHAGQVVYAAFSPDAREAASACADGSLQCWDVQTGTPRDAMKAFSGYFTKVLYTPDSAILITVSDQQEVAVWNRAGFTERCRVPGKDAVVSGDGRWLAVVQGGDASLFDLSSGAPGPVLKGEGEIQRLCMSRKADRVLTGSSDGQVRLYDAASGAVLRTYMEKESSDHRVIDEVAFADKETVVLAWDRGNHGYAWEAVSGNSLNRIAGGNSWTTMLDFGRDGRRVVVACADSSFQCFDPLYQTGRELLKAGNHLQPYCVADFCAATGQAALRSYGEVRVLSSDTTVAATFFASSRVQLDSCSQSAFSPDGNAIAITTDPFTPAVWNLSSQERVLLRGHNDWVFGIAFDPSGKRVATASFDATARIWDAASGNSLLTLEGHHDVVSSVEFSPDGTGVLTGSWDGTAALWDAASGQQLRSFSGHRDGVSNAIFAEGGRRIYTASTDGSIRVWDARTGALVHLVTEHGTPVSRVTLNPGSPFLVAGVADGTTRLWNASTYDAGLVLSGLKQGQYLVASHQVAGNLPDGRVESWGAAPWGGTETTSTSYDAYRIDDYRKHKDAFVPNPVPGKICLDTSDRMLDIALGDALAAAASPSPAEHAGLTLLGLQPTDQILSVDNKPADTPEQCVQGLQELRTAAQAQASGRWLLRIRRGLSEIPVELRATPMQETQLNATLNREEAQHLIRGIKNGLLSQPYYAAPPYLDDRGSALLLQKSGMGVSMPSELIENLQKSDGGRESLRKAHLAQSEALIRVDDVNTVEDGALLRYLGDLDAQIAAGACAGFSIETRHGNYQRILIAYTVK